MIVLPETVLRWRRIGWAAIWGYRSRGSWRGGRPRGSSEGRHLINRTDGPWELSLGCAADTWRASHARVHGLPSHGIVLPARTRQTANTVVADLSSQSSQCVRPVFRGAVRGIRASACSVPLGQAQAIHGCADCDGVHWVLARPSPTTARPERWKN